jgi:putative copper export protein
VDHDARKEGAPTALAALVRWALYVQAVVYVVTGLWPIVHLESFEAVTGEKYDDFLVHTVGLLLFVVGAVLLQALRRRRESPELLWIAAGTAASLAAIDVTYWLGGRLAPIYLLDAAAELAFVAANALRLRSLARERAR